MNTLCRTNNRVKKPATIVALTAIAVTTAPACLGCTAEVAPIRPDPEKVAAIRTAPSASPTVEAVAYNTPPYAAPGPQYDSNGNLLGTQTNPFTLIVTQKFADATHKDYWAVDPLANYGTFHQPIFLSGVWQYKWIACGTVGAGC